MDGCRAIGVTRLGEQKKNVKWAGLYGSGGENQTYGFEPHVSASNSSSHLSHFAPVSGDLFLGVRLYD